MGLTGLLLCGFLVVHLAGNLFLYVGEDAYNTYADALHEQEWPVRCACIGCAACVAACRNASAMLFVSAKVSQLAVLPQGQTERSRRVLNMVAAMDREGFGACTNTSECEAVCPAGISVSHIARLNREYLKAMLAAGPD